jgi:valyl-tRNA synthetase
MLQLAAAVLREVRKAKSEANLPLRTSARSVEVAASEPHAALIAQVSDDLREAGVAEELRVVPGPSEELSVSVVLDGATANDGN